MYKRQGYFSGDDYTDDFINLNNANTNGSGYIYFSTSATTDWNSQTGDVYKRQCVGRPCVLFGKVSPDTAIAFSDDVRGYRFPAPIDAVNGVVLRTAVPILNGICKVCIKGQSFNDFSFQASVHTGQVCCCLLYTSRCV